MIVAGIGYRKAATLADLRGALALTGAKPDALASTERKTREAPMTTLAEEMNVPLLALSEDQLAGIQTATQSPRIAAQFATGSLAEAAALLGAGYDKNGVNVRLIVPRVQTDNGMATAAIAERIPQ